MNPLTKTTRNIISTVLFGDEEIASEILASDDPRHQKALGRKVKPFDEKVWGANCKDIVKRGNMAKVITHHAGIYVQATCGYRPYWSLPYVISDCSSE